MLGKSTSQTNFAGCVSVDGKQLVKNNLLFLGRSTAY